MASEDFLEVLVNPENANVDVIAVHGLQPLPGENHAMRTWTSEKSKKIWLSDVEFLPKWFPQARILLFGYNAGVAFQSSPNGVEKLAGNLLSKIKSKREDLSQKRGIVFICHSLGGIIVKRALVKQTEDDSYISIQKAVYGVAFFATPHQGGKGARIGDVLATVVNSILRTPHNSFLEALKKDSAFAESVSNDFVATMKHLEVISFFETKRYKNFGKVVVEKDSATIDREEIRETMVGMDADHSSICKFEDPDGVGFQKVVKHLGRLIEPASRLAEVQLPIPVKKWVEKMETKDNDSQQRAIEVLCSLALAIRLPTPPELAVITGLPRGTYLEPQLLTDELELLCGPLLAISEEEVGFYHSDTKSLILSGALFFVNLDELHRRIASRSFQYICGYPIRVIREKEDKDDKDKRDILVLWEKTVENPECLQYPLVYWADHARSAPSQIAGDFDLNAQFFGSQSLRRSSWLRMYQGILQSYQISFETSPLCVCAYLGLPWLVEMLLKKGDHDQRDINRKDDMGYTPIHYAARGGYSETVEVLLNNGANPDITMGGARALHIATVEGHRAVVDLLLQRQPENIDATTDSMEPMTSLHLAAQMGHAEMVELLLSRGANVHAAARRKTALHFATEGGHKEVACLLSEALE